ncbi:spore coat protein [Inediibacterium massiliense]|uniref:spore coat protein n=1 Tax=Inediibacterium massiliense TaxID=1658111 RepID=UPI0006B51D09|nr:spore coat protein [Inediibacterium massiliense]
MTNLTQKEKYLLQDQKSHEELCIKKYNNHASKAKDPQLKQLFLSLGQQEQQHLNTINQILNGQVPNMNQSSQQNMQNIQNQFSTPSNMKHESDKDLCTDLLATEKYVSSTYDTSIFEFKDHNIRQALNHIQKEEQEHGEAIFKYMEAHGMYNLQ